MNDAPQPPPDDAKARATHYRTRAFAVMAQLACRSEAAILDRDDDRLSASSAARIWRASLSLSPEPAEPQGTRPRSRKRERRSERPSRSYPITAK